MQNGDCWLQEIDNPHNYANRLNWLCLAYDYSHQIWILYYFVFNSYEISKTLNAYIPKLVLWHLSTASTTVFNFISDFFFFFFFFAVFCFFWITLSVARILSPNSFGKVLFWVTVDRDPPWPLTGVHYTLTTWVLTSPFSQVSFSIMKSWFPKPLCSGHSKKANFQHKIDSKWKMLILIEI